MANANSRKGKPSKEHGFLSGKGISEDVTWLMIGMVILVLTVALFYFIFPRTSCDQLAQVSSQELKSAMECAAKYPDGKDATGKPCNVAQVKLCQENSFSIVGVGFTQAYLGMMLPEYMAYYQQFPTQPVVGLGLLSGPSVFATGLKFSESYPFERAYTGQRPWDFKPTFTQFKQFFQTRYLQKGCTDDQALCFNTRGREELVRTDLPGIEDVRLRRDGMGFAETNPKFHLVAPCYARVTFKKDGTNLLGTVITQDAGGSSNYCYATEGALTGLAASYAGEVSCEVGMFILDFMTLGGKKAITEGAKVGAEVAAKEVGKVVAKDIAKEVVEQTAKRVGRTTTRKEIGKIVVEETLTATEKRIGRSLTTVEKTAIRNAVEKVASAKPTNAQLAKLASQAAAKRYYRMEGMYSVVPFQDNPQKLASLFGLFIPCVDVDVCRAAFSCTEALIWPGGFPVQALEPDDMKGGRSAGATSEVFFQCCDTFNYGTEKDPTKITCSEPDYLVEALRPELKLNETDPVTLDVLGKHLGWGTADIPGACSMAKGDNSKDCRETREVRAAGLPPDRCVVFPGDGVDPIYTHTYDFGTVKDVRNATVMARLATEQCDSTIKVEVSNDAASWSMVASAGAEQFPNETFIGVDGPLTFQYLRVSEDGGCAFDTSGVALNPTVDSVVKVEPDVTYELGKAVWNYFEMPAGFSSTAKGICNSVKDCIDVGIWIPEESTWQHWSYDPKVGELGVNFQVFGGDRIGILTTEVSEVVFKVGG